MLYKGLLVLAWVFLVSGIIGLFRFRNFYSKALICSKIDTVAFFTIMIALVFYQGFNLFSLKVIIMAIFFMFTNPVSTHLIVRAAYSDGLRTDLEQCSRRRE